MSYYKHEENLNKFLDNESFDEKLFNFKREMWDSVYGPIYKEFHDQVNLIDIANSARYIICLVFACKLVFSRYAGTHDIDVTLDTLGIEYLLNKQDNPDARRFREVCFTKNPDDDSYFLLVNLLWLFTNINNIANNRLGVEETALLCGSEEGAHAAQNLCHPDIFLDNLKEDELLRPILERASTPYEEQAAKVKVWFANEFLSPAAQRFAKHIYETIRIYKNADEIGKQNMIL